MLQTNNPKHYFPNLNGLRFIAAFMVVISHIELFKTYYHLPNIYRDLRFFFIGKLGVQLFFVLSGFLITYLLLNEKHTKSTINIKHFYVRRILKIWPLYFLIGILGLFILPKIDLFYVPTLTEHISDGFSFKVLQTFIFVPNITVILYPFLPFTFQFWSIAIEEQFYLFVPWLMKKIKNSIVPFIIIILLVIVSKFTIKEIYANHRSLTIQNLYSFIYYFHIDVMSVGAIFAHIYHYNYKLINLLYHPIFQIINIAVFIVYYFTNAIHYPYYQDEYYAIVFGIIILNAATNPRNIIKVENVFFRRMGEASYSTYMVHLITIAFSFRLLYKFNLLNNVTIYAVSIVSTYILSILVNKYFEKWFLRFKSSYQ